MIKRLWQCIVPYHPFHQTSTNISIRAELSGLIWKSCVDRWAYQENAKKLSIIVVNFIAFLMFLMPDTEKYWKFLMTMLWQIDCDVADNQSNVSFECLDWNITSRLQSHCDISCLDFKISVILHIFTVCIYMYYWYNFRFK